MLHLVHSGHAIIELVHLLGTKKKECSWSLIGFIHCGEAISRAMNTMLIVNDFTLEPLKWAAPVTILMVHSQGPMKRTIVQTIQYNIKFT